MKKYVYVLFATLAFSCASENQQEGLDNVLSHYGGSASFSKSINSSVGQETINSFDIKVSNSFMLDTLRPDLSTAKIAMILFDSFSQKEKENYNQVKVEVVNSANKKSSIYDYDTQRIINLLDQNKIFTEFSENLIKQNYELIAQNIKPEYRTENIAGGLQQFMKDLTDKHGKLIKYKATEVGLFNTKDEQQYQFKGFLAFQDGYYRNYFITTSKSTDVNYIAGFKLNI